MSIRQILPKGESPIQSYEKTTFRIKLKKSTYFRQGHTYNLNPKTYNLQ
jgi:hypothetical protein